MLFIYKIKKKKKTYKDREKTEERGVRERGEEEEGVRERENVCFLLPSTRMFVSGWREVGGGRIGGGGGIEQETETPHTDTHTHTHTHTLTHTHIPQTWHTKEALNA